MIVEVCVGSSCHLKGSYEIIQLFRKRLQEESLLDRVEFKGTFCLGKCGIAGVSVKVDDEIITGITKENFEKVFKEKILDKLK